MLRIGATLTGLERQLLHYLDLSNAAAARHALRLASGQRVNRPSDDPSSFLQISMLQSRQVIVSSTIGNIEAASNLAAEAQLTLDQIHTQLDAIRTALIADEDQSLTAAERAEKQAEIDAAIEQINELAKTQIEGRGLLDGSSNYRFSGRDSSQIRSLQVISTRDTSLSGSVTTEAEQATLEYAGLLGNVISDATFTLTGKLGSTTITVTSGQALTDVADAINADSHNTGITASVSGSTLEFRTVDYGTEATIAIEVTSGTFNVTGGNGDGTAQGVDAVAEINGRILTGDGNRFIYNQNGLHVRIEFVGGFSGPFSDVEIYDTATRKFTLLPDPQHIIVLGLPGIQAAQLGGLSGSLDQLLSGGSLSGLAANTSQAIRVVDEALGQLAIIEGRVQGFADATVDSSAALMDGLETTLEDALEQINGIDEDEENLLLSKNQDLASSALASLNILQQQRTDLVDLLRQIAGLS